MHCSICEERIWPWQPKVIDSLWKAWISKSTRKYLGETYNHKECNYEKYKKYANNKD